MNSQKKKPSQIQTYDQAIFFKSIVFFIIIIIDSVLIKTILKTNY